VDDRNPFLVWCEEAGESDQDAEESFADSAAEAAEEWAENRHADEDYFDEIDVCVKAPDGTVSKWTVTVEMEPTFSASPSKAKSR